MGVLTKVLFGLLAASAITTRVGLSQVGPGETVLLRPNCPRCAIDLRSVGQFGSEVEGEVNAGRPFEVMAAFPDGKILAAARRQTVLWEFTPNGSVIRQFARMGEGPGELRTIGTLLARSDTIYAYEHAGRFSLYARNGAFLRSMRLQPSLRSVLPLKDGRIVASGRVGSADPVDRDRRAGLPLHLFERDSLIRSFGEVIKEIDPRNPLQFDKLLVPYHEGFLAINRTNHYVIEYWNAAGTTRIARLVREPTWFPPSKTVNFSDHTLPPTTTLTGAWIDDDGLLWVVAKRARSTWRESYGPAQRGEGGQIYAPVVKPELRQEGAVEVIDVEKRQLVYTGTLNFVPNFVIGHGFVVTQFDEGQGFRFFRLGLRRP